MEVLNNNNFQRQRGPKICRLSAASGLFKKIRPARPPITDWVPQGATLVLCAERTSNTVSKEKWGERR